uniref:Uncharacterized protein n=1 Tax=Anopheles atroparvus TaxID=41427 RepID=A0AAG5DRP2_ANOAO
MLVELFLLPNAPIMTAAIFCGTKKPESNEEYLRPLVKEINALIVRGIIINGEHIAIKMRSIVADTPARAFIKGVTGHNGYNGCLKCTVEGVYHSAGRTMTFPGINAAKRTDHGFRSGVYSGHHKTTTPLLDVLNFDIIEDVIVSDRLHLIDLGVMKRLVVAWRDGTQMQTHWLPEDCKEISAMLRKIELPIEIHRKLRPIKFAKFWKGSEYASFLQYASIVVLKEQIPYDAYNHFLLLYCGVTLLSSESFKKNGRLLESFSDDSCKTMGGFMVHNMWAVMCTTFSM